VSSGYVAAAATADVSSGFVAAAATADGTVFARLRLEETVGAKFDAAGSGAATAAAAAADAAVADASGDAEEVFVLIIFGGAFFTPADLGTSGDASVDTPSFEGEAATPALGDTLGLIIDASAVFDDLRSSTGEVREAAVIEFWKDAFGIAAVGALPRRPLPRPRPLPLPFSRAIISDEAWLAESSCLGQHL
jgi:hypothetical protein